VTPVGDALVDLLLRAIEEGRPRLRDIADWVVDAARPPQGLRLVADDGTLYTGFLFVKDNEPVVVLAVRADRPRHPPVTQQHRQYVDEPAWFYDDAPPR